MSRNLLLKTLSLMNLLLFSLSTFAEDGAREGIQKKVDRLALLAAPEDGFTPLFDGGIL